MENIETAKIIFDRLNYDPNTGLIVWIIARQGISIGSKAGTLDKNGYKKIMVNCRYYGAHRIAWLLHYGVWPNGIIDHIDGDPSNNKICNLRISTTSLNAANKKIPKTNASGFKGVSWAKSCNKWYASIKINGKSKNLGFYDDPNNAHEAYMKAASFHFGEHARAL